jgi:hypothetical protein
MRQTTSLWALSPSSLEKRSATKDDYVSKIAQPAHELRNMKLLLAEDVQRLVYAVAASGREFN